MNNLTCIIYTTIPYPLSFDIAAINRDIARFHRARGKTERKGLANRDAGEGGGEIYIQRRASLIAAHLRSILCLFALYLEAYTPKTLDVCINGYFASRLALHQDALVPHQARFRTRTAYAQSLLVH
jgi:hypothetical protein